MVNATLSPRLISASVPNIVVEGEIGPATPQITGSMAVIKQEPFDSYSLNKENCRTSENDIYVLNNTILNINLYGEWKILFVYEIL